MSKFFNEEEMRCKCCGELPVNGIDPKLYELLDNMRESIGRPLYVNCAYRCPAHNAEVGGVPNSQHVLGTASDIDASDIGVEELAQIAEKCGADGIGRYFDSCFVHVDTRGEYARWED